MFVCASTTGRARSSSVGGEIGQSVGNRVGKLTLWDLKTMKAEVRICLFYNWAIEKKIFELLRPDFFLLVD